MVLDKNAVKFGRNSERIDDCAYPSKTSCPKLVSPENGVFTSVYRASILVFPCIANVCVCTHFASISNNQVSTI